MNEPIKKLDVKDTFHNFELGIRINQLVDRVNELSRTKNYEISLLLAIADFVTTVDSRKTEAMLRRIQNAESKLFGMVNREGDQ